VRTTGVVLGADRALLLARGLMFASTAYAALVIHPISAAVTVVAFLVPFRKDEIERYWTRIKLIYGIAWLCTCVFVYLSGHSSGLLLAINRSIP